MDRRCVAQSRASQPVAEAHPIRSAQDLPGEVTRRSVIGVDPQVGQPLLRLGGVGGLLGDLVQWARASGVGVASQMPT